MPDVDGFGVAARIADRPELAGATIMMLTSGGQYGDTARCRELGISSYLTKPVKQADLFSAICQALDGSAPATAKRALQAQPLLPVSTGVRRILLAEDNVVNQRVAVGLLNKRGHQVTVVNNGLEALAAHHSGTFDVVLMDVQMPEMGGFDATAAIRNRERSSGAPRLRIVAMTAHAMIGDRERCLTAGMDDYLAKPIDPRALYAAVERATIAAQPPRPAGDLPFDRPALLERLSGDEQLLADVVQLFLEDCPQRVAAIKVAIEAGSADGVRAEAHGLKGAAGNLSAEPVVRAARALEELGTGGRLDGADQAWQKLSAETDRLLDALRRHNICEA
jgi:CheY-like chemotaxis protein/HPt (histidine-containing phosphotransfer) domain-containing protein